jgi:hypothetical protein
MVAAADHMSQDSFDRVQNLRHLYDKTLIATACCENNAQVLEMLLSSLSLDPDHSRALKSTLTSLTGFRNSSDVLQKRIRNAIDMVCTFFHPAFCVYHSS